MSSYVRHFPVVEVQHTFYEPPADALMRKWRAGVPAEFEFTMKAWQIVTHESGSPTYRRLKHPLPEEDRGHVGAFRSTTPVMAAWARTLECAQILGATAVLLQCPKSFRPTAENVNRMRDLLGTIRRPSGRLLWEPRGAWPTSLIAELCRDLDLAHVVDPMQHDTVTPDKTYFRLHGTSGMRHVHRDDELRRVRDLIDGRPDPYVMFNNLARVADAQRFIDIL
ncbi:MAG: hypothetical protein JWL72_2202 [Ilumatobacteraceae bacterium]|nr:hypothetical protein [Ilumatobacteraceae bacterium]MCU1388864.1 hypothetical protein [Ilumatobacteraceae bacterium]